MKDLEALATLFRRADIVSALVDMRTATHQQAMDAARASLEIESRGDHWAAEIVEMGTGKVSG